MRTFLLPAIGALVWRPTLWTTPSTRRTQSLALFGAALVPVPYALNSHAAALVEGGPTAITVDWLHLMAASIWIGGLFTLAIGLVTTRAINVETRRELLADVIPRFSTLAIISVVILAITGFYAAWLEVGNLNALLHTTYGHTLIVKLVLLIPLLLLGAANLLLVGPRMRQNAQTVLHFGRTRRR